MVGQGLLDQGKEYVETPDYWRTLVEGTGTKSEAEGGSSSSSNHSGEGTPVATTPVKGGGKETDPPMQLEINDNERRDDKVENGSDGGAGAGISHLDTTTTNNNSLADAATIGKEPDEEKAKDVWIPVQATKDICYQLSDYFGLPAGINSLDEDEEERTVWINQDLGYSLFKSAYSMMEKGFDEDFGLNKGFKTGRTDFGERNVASNESQPAPGCSRYLFANYANAFGAQFGLSVDTSKDEEFARQLMEEEKQLFDAEKRDEELARQLMEEERKLLLMAEDRDKEFAMRLVAEESDKEMAQRLMDEEKDRQFATQLMDEDEGGDIDIEDLIQQIMELESSSKALRLQLDELPFTLKEEEFPVLCEVLQDKESELRMKKFNKLTEAKWTMAQNVKCSQIKHLFPSLDANMVEDAFIQNELNYDNTLAYLRDTFPSKYQERQHQRQEEQPVESAKDKCGNDVYYDPDQVAKMTAAEKQQYLDEANSWRLDAERYLETYQSTKKQVERQKTIKTVRALRAMDVGYFNQLARNALEQYMFFTVVGVNAGNRNPNKIDMHGLSVPKAKDIAIKFIQNRKVWASNHLPNNTLFHVTIICGWGKHSINNIPKLCPAIRKLLNDNGYMYSENDGNFVIHIKNIPGLVKSQRAARVSVLPTPKFLSRNGIRM